MPASIYDGPWPLDPFRVWPLRRQVLRPHQPPAASEYPADADPLAFHVGVFLDGELVAVGSLFPEDGWRIRGMATSEAHRRQGLGTAVFEALVEGAAQRGGGRIWCNARTSAAPFYEARGMRADGGVFELPGLGPHRVMMREVEGAPVESGFDLARSRELLQRTPAVLDAWLRGLPREITEVPEGPGLWAIRDLIGHLLHGEEDDWIVRVEHVLGPRSHEPFEPFERCAMFRRFHGWSLDALLDALAARRGEAIERLDALGLRPTDLERTGRHPTFGTVTLGQLLASWVAHDLSHLAQAARILAAPIAPHVGPWARFIRIARD